MMYLSYASGARVAPNPPTPMGLFVKVVTSCGGWKSVSYKNAAPLVLLGAPTNRNGPAAASAEPKWKDPRLGIPVGGLIAVLGLPVNSYTLTTPEMLCWGALTARR